MEMMELRRKTDSDVMFSDILGLMDLMPVGIRWVNQDGGCEYLNRTFVEMFGYSLQEIHSIDDWFMLAYPDPDYRSEISGWHQERVSTLESGLTPPSLKANITCKDGTIKKVVITTHIALGRLIAIYTDITELAKFEDQNLEIEKMFRLTFEGARDAIFWTNAGSGILVNCNRAAEEMIEAPRTEIIGKHFTSLHPPDTKEKIIALFEKSAAIPEPREDIEAEVLRRSGKRLPVLIRSSNTKIGDTCIAQGIFLDVSRRKRAEDALRKSEARSRAMIEAFDGLMYICSQERKIEFMNRQMIDRIGYDATGELCYKALHKFESVCPWCIHDRVFKGEKVQSNFQSPKDGRWYHISSNPIKDTKGIISKQVMITNITDRKLAEQNHIALEAQKSLNEEQRQFLGLLSHEIRTPLAVIDGAAQLLHLTSTRESSAYTQAERIRGGVLRLSNLIDSCLTDERLSTGGWQPDMRKHDLGLIVKSAPEHARSLIRKHVVVTDLSRLPDQFVCDAVLIKVMMGNLFDNAVKYSPDGGQITLRGNILDNGVICIEVSDEGIGIPPDQLETIFKRFYRTRQISGVVGAGLGLHLVKKIAELHGGDVTCQSILGAGTTFSVTLNPQLP